MPTITARVKAEEYDMVVLDVVDREHGMQRRRPRLKEIIYLKEVARANEAAIIREAGDIDNLEDLASREDGVGQLARVFQQTIRQIRAREDELRREVHELRIEIDTVRRNQEVSKITDTEFFNALRQQARQLRAAR